MDATDQPLRSPLLSSLVLAAEGACGIAILVVAGGGDAFGRTMVSAVVILALAALVLVHVGPARRMGETLVLALHLLAHLIALLVVLAPFVVPR